MDEVMSGFCSKAGGRSSGGGNGGTKCGRWNPTIEQVKVLTDLFRSGLRTPSTDQIQKISYQLGFYGKIESKNVFYWFQNHKARERQKRRRISVVENPSPIELQEKSLPTKRVDQVTDSERVIETLQLFPLNSYEESEPEKLRVMMRNECKETTFFCGTRREYDYQTLDLRLSFT